MKRFEFKPAGYLYKVQPPPMLVEGVLPARSVSVIIGVPGLGKTWFCLEMCRAIATGTPFLGKFPVVPGAAAFIGSDSSDPDYASQWRRLTARQYAELGGLMPDPEYTYSDEDGNVYESGDLNPLSDRVRFLNETDFSLDSNEDVIAIIDALRFAWGMPEFVRHAPYINDEDEVVHPGFTETVYQEGASLLVIDSWSAVTGAEEDVQAVADTLVRKARLISKHANCAVLIIGHTPKNGDMTWRGAGAKEGAVDNVLALRHVRRGKKKVQGLVELEFQKFRGIRPAPFRIEYNTEDPEAASLLWLPPAAEPKPEPEYDPEPSPPADPDREVMDNLEESILTLLARGPQSTPAMAGLLFPLRREVDQTHEAFKRGLQRKLATLVKEDKVVQLSGGNGTPATWGLPEPE